jgi:hypothetical protein
MSEEQQRFGDAYPTLAYYLDQLPDWRLGIVTTDTDAPSRNDEFAHPQGGPDWLSRAVPDPAAWFAAATYTGSGGAIDERGLRAIQRLLDAQPQFRRPDADLHLLVLSDEDDASNNNPTVNAFVRDMERRGTTSMSALVGPRGGCPIADPGVRYLDASRALGGERESICDAEAYDRIFDGLGRRMVQVQRRFRLSAEPLEGSISAVLIAADGFITVVEEASTCSDCVSFRHEPSTNELVFPDRPPTVAQELRVTYEAFPSE